MAWLGPLHFGTFAGNGVMKVPVKILWLLLGLAPPLLMVTGFLMYWNRYLSKRWAALNLARGADKGADKGMDKGMDKASLRLTNS